MRVPCSREHSSSFAPRACQNGCPTTTAVRSPPRTLAAAPPGPRKPAGSVSASTERPPSRTADNRHTCASATAPPREGGPFLLEANCPGQELTRTSAAACPSKLTGSQCGVPPAGPQHPVPSAVPPRPFPKAPTTCQDRRSGTGACFQRFLSRQPCGPQLHKGDRQGSRAKLTTTEVMSTEQDNWHQEPWRRREGMVGCFPTPRVLCPVKLAGGTPCTILAPRPFISLSPCSDALCVSRPNSQHTAQPAPYPTVDNARPGFGPKLSGQKKKHLSC